MMIFDSAERLVQSIEHCSDAVIECENLLSCLSCHERIARAQISTSVSSSPCEPIAIETWF